MYIACLMAGIGSRLAPLTTHCHKATLDVAGQSLIARQLAHFAAAGLADATFVLGHGAAELAVQIAHGFAKQPFRLINNPHYVTRNLDWSAWLALSSVQDDVIYFEGDLLVPPSLLRQLAASPADICIAVDSLSQSPSIDTVAYAAQGKVAALQFVEHGRAQLQRADGALGELICTVKLSNRARQFVVDALARLDYTGPMQLYQILERAFARFDTSYVDAEGRPWVEIDNAGDLARARDLAAAIAAA
ncbi:hypothetical protein JCM19000A_12690 [Silvimonas sp. JCM 19000]